MNPACNRFAISRSLVFKFTRGSIGITNSATASKVFESLRRTAACSRVCRCLDGARGSCGLVPCPVGVDGAIDIVILQLFYWCVLLFLMMLCKYLFKPCPLNCFQSLFRNVFVHLETSSGHGSSHGQRRMKMNSKGREHTADEEAGTLLVVFILF